MTETHPLTPLLAPRSLIVLAGETPMAAQLRQTLKAQRFQGELAFADLSRSGTLADLAKSRADLALLALSPAELAAGCELAARIGCRAALALGRDVDEHGARALHEAAEQQGLPLLGPNSLGLQNPALGLNASLFAPLAQPGRLGLVSQSAALTATLLDWASANGIGFSSVVNLGPHAGVDVPELLSYLAADPRTQVILLHIEGVSDARAFMSALRLAASSKPVLVLKTGRNAAAAAAAPTHSGLLAGRDEVFDSALRRTGAVRVDSMNELFAVTKVLATEPGRRFGSRLAVVSQGGGPALLAADAAQELGLTVCGVHERLEDVGEDADGVLLLHAPLPGSDALAEAQALIAARPKRPGLPLLACWLGERAASAARARLGEAGIAAFRTPEAALKAWAQVLAWQRNQRLLEQVPAPRVEGPRADIAGARLLIETVLAQRRSLLTERESKALLAAFHIPVTQTLRADSAHEAMLIATQIGYPVALKIDSDGHKSDVGGVLLNLRDAASVRDAFEELAGGGRRVTVQPMARLAQGRELHIGLVTEPPFGPVIVAGAGGTQVELIGDVQLELPPLNPFLAEQLLQRTRANTMLGAWRGAPAVDREALVRLLMRVSEMACALPQLQQMDINPVLVDAQGCVAVDARIVLAPVVQVPSAASRYPHLAIRPFPAELAEPVSLRDGSLAELRAIHPEDGQALQQLVAELSPESRYNRFAATLKELPPALLARFALIDYEREMALVIEKGARIIGVSRYTLNPGGRSAEFALLVADGFAGQGLGRRLMERLIAVAREQGLERLDGLVLRQNSLMLKLVRGLGFEVRPFEGDEDFRLASLQL